MKEAINRAFSHLRARKAEIGLGRELGTLDLHVEAIDFLGNKVEAENGMAFAVPALSALRKAPPQPGATDPRRPIDSGEREAGAFPR